MCGVTVVQFWHDMSSSPKSIKITMFYAVLGYYYSSTCAQHLLLVLIVLFIFLSANDRPPFRNVQIYLVGQVGWSHDSHVIRLYGLYGHYSFSRPYQPNRMVIYTMLHLYIKLYEITHSINWNIVICISLLYMKKIRV